MAEDNREILPISKLDELYLTLKKFPEADMPLTHRFCPNLYIREIRMPAGAMVISKIHKFEHPYVVSDGKLLVWHQDGSTLAIEAPYTGITKPYTQRVLYILEDTTWTTFHVTNLTSPDEIVDAITVHPDGNSITIRDFKMKILQEKGS